MFTGSLFPVQKPTAEKLCNRRRMLLAWEQGTGKTIISIAAAEKLFELGKIKNALIIGRPGDYWQWGEKLEEFSTSRFLMAQAQKEVSRTYRPTKSVPYVLTNWNLFRRDYANIARRKWDLVIADEAQEFRNHTTKTAQLIKRLNVRVDPRYRWALTGTAIGNKLEELYSIMYWVDPHFLPPWPVFEENHCVRGSLGLISGYKNLKALNTFLERRMDRKTHDDLKGQMPKLVQQIHKIEPTQSYLKSQDKLLKLLDNMAANLTFDDEGEPQLRRNSQVSKTFSKVRTELCSGAKLRYAIKLADSILAENPNNRVVFFSHLKDPLYRLGEHYRSSATFFTGDQSTEEKRSNLQEFKLRRRILLASDAGKAGLDLPYANYIIHLDVPFSWEVLDQRNKRITRASSLFDTAVVNYLIMEDSIEEFFYEVVMNKGRLASGALEGKIDEVTMRPSSLREWIRDDE